MRAHGVTETPCATITIYTDAKLPVIALSSCLLEKRLDLCRGVELESLLGKLVALCLAPLGNGLASAQDARCGHRELVEAPGDQKRLEQRIGCGLAAHTDHDTGLGAALDNVLERTKDSRIVNLIEVGDGVVAAVGAHGVADEVVRADGEEVGNLGELVGDEGGGRSLDHDTDLDVLVELTALVGQLLLALLDKLLDGHDFLYAGNERNHDLDVAEGACTQQGAKLNLVLIGVREAIANGAEAHEGVILFLHVQIRNLLIAAHIERADDDGSALEGRSDLAVRVELVLLGRSSAESMNRNSERNRPMASQS